MDLFIKLQVWFDHEEHSDGGSFLLHPTLSSHREGQIYGVGVVGKSSHAHVCTRSLKAPSAPQRSESPECGGDVGIRGGPLREQGHWPIGTDITAGGGGGHQVARVREGYSDVMCHPYASL